MHTVCSVDVCVCVCVFICFVSKGKNLSRMLREIWIVCHHLATTTIAVHLILYFVLLSFYCYYHFRYFLHHIFLPFSLHVQIVQGESHPEWTLYIDRTNGSTCHWVMTNDRWFSIPCSSCDVCSTTLFSIYVCAVVVGVFIFLFFIRLCCLSVWFMRIWFFTGALCSHPHATCSEKNCLHKMVVTRVPFLKQYAYLDTVFLLINFLNVRRSFVDTNDNFFGQMLQLLSLLEFWTRIQYENSHSLSVSGKQRMCSLRTQYIATHNI